MALFIISIDWSGEVGWVFSCWNWWKGRLEWCFKEALVNLSGRSGGLVRIGSQWLVGSYEYLLWW